MTERRWAATAADETAEQVRAALDELEEHRYILIDWDTEEILVRTFARHDGVVRNHKTFGPAWRQLNNVASPALRAAAEAELAALGDRPDDYEDRASSNGNSLGDRASPGNGDRASPGRNHNGDREEDRASPTRKPTRDELEDRPRAGALAASSLQPLPPASGSFLLVPDPGIPHPDTPTVEAAGNPDDDDGRPGNLEQAAIDVLARRRLDRRRTEVGPVDQPEPWLAKVRRELAAAHRDALTALDLRVFATPEQLADHLEPPAKPAGVVVAADRMQAAAAALAARSDMPECPVCHTKGCFGWVPAPDGAGVVRCPEATKIGSSR